MVKGLELFRDWFAGFAEQYVLIGGTAASITMEGSALPFRATRDLDVVLHVEALTPDFARAFWAFVEAGGYLKREVSAEAGRCFYRFHPPQDERFLAEAAEEERLNPPDLGVRATREAVLQRLAVSFGIA